MSRVHRALVAGLAVGALLADAGVAAEAAAPRDGDELRRALPRPGKASLKGTREYAGFEQGGRRAVAVVVHRNGSALAFVCDGKTSWGWLTGRVRGGRLALRGERGTRLTGVVRGARLTGVLRRGGKARRLALARSVRSGALRRLVDGRFEGAWVVTSAGQIRGVGTIGKTVVISSSADGTAPTEDEGTTAAGDEQVTAGLLTKARCAVLLLKTTTLRARRDLGTATEQELAELAGLLEKIRALGCREALGGPAVQP